MAKWLEALGGLAEDLGLIPSLTWLTSFCNSSSKDSFLTSPGAKNAHGLDIHADRIFTHTK